MLASLNCLSPILPAMSFPFFTIALLCLSLLTSSLAFTPGFPYGSQKVRGVNLGGWLVLEVRISSVQYWHNLSHAFIAMDYAKPIRQHWQQQDC